ncbi:hypothetical protein [Acidisphaera rubrifaciens]|uniref:DUF4760 domain-containing protein n=1 Tax=Acidisphaera rubrifaciens HS-AP3 TaxID=1231350 RepID=A0A0D6P3T0_9PROT|nr:hypothetical protein [Acidisphaera rubrifaciens]GAN76307.1 hypothetical protein Asru_0084_18 [Acidisphaera rubrifaciens HS-AP3]
MTLAELSQLSQAAGSAAVVASLIFIGIQIHQSTKSARAASHHAVSEALNRINLLWARDGEVARIWLLGMGDRGALTQEERWRFDSLIRAYLHVCETMYTQARLGSGDRGIVLAEEDGIRTVFSSAGAIEWWAENPFGFAPEFRAYVERLITSPIQTGVRSR